MTDKYNHKLYGDINVERTFTEYGINFVVFNTTNLYNKIERRYCEDLYTFTLNTTIIKDK